MDGGQGVLAVEELVAHVRAAVRVVVGIAELMREAIEVAAVVAEIVGGIGASGSARHKCFRAVEFF